MNILKQLFTIAFSTATIVSFAQPVNTTKAESLPYIEITGTAEKEVIPDEIYIAIIIRERYVNKTKVTIEEQEEKLKNVVKSLNMDLKNLYVSGANADYVKIGWQKKDVLTKKDYVLKVSSASELGQVFQELEKLEITDAYISKVNHSKIDSLRKEVRIKAIKAAKDKADYLLMAIGEQTGKPLVVTENIQGGDREYMNRLNPKAGYANTSNVYQDNNVDKENELQFQKIKLSSSMYVKFAIK